MENGSDWCPGCGDKVVVICDPGESQEFQITFIEAVLCEVNPVEDNVETNNENNNDKNSPGKTTSGKNNQKPIASATVDVNTGNPGLHCTFNAKDSYDPDGNIVFYIWDFDNGITEKTDQKEIMHIFTSVGKYQVMLTVEDDKGAFDTLNEAIIIEIISANNPPENLIVISDTNWTHQNINVSFTMNATDPDENDAIRFEINWGDNTVFVSDQHISEEIFEISHNWDTFGIYTVTVTAKDEQNASTAKSSITIIVDVIVIDDMINAWLIDTNSDGCYDLFLDTETGVKTQLQQRTETIYLIDINNDSIMNYQFDTYTNRISMEKQNIREESYKPLFLSLIGFYFFIIVLILIGLMIYLFKRQKNTQLSKKQNVRHK